MARIDAELDAVEQTRALLAEAGTPVTTALPDPGPALDALRVEGTSLDAATLRDVAAFLMAVWRLRQRTILLPAIVARAASAATTPATHVASRPSSSRK